MRWENWSSWKLLEVLKVLQALSGEAQPWALDQSAPKFWPFTARWYWPMTCYNHLFICSAPLEIVSTFQGGTAGHYPYIPEQTTWLDSEIFAGWMNEWMDQIKWHLEETWFLGMPTNTVVMNGKWKKKNKKPLYFILCVTFPVVPLSIYKISHSSVMTSLAFIQSDHSF